MDINFSFSDLLSYWDTLNISLLSILFAAIIGAVTGFIVILITEILLRKKILVARKYKVLKYVAYLYMLFFPLFSAFCCSSWFVIANTEKQIISNIPDYLGEDNELFNKYLKVEVEKVIKAKYLELTGKQVVDKALFTTANFIEQTELIEGKFERFMVRHLMETSMVREMILSKVTSSMGNALFLNEQIMDELLEIEFRHLLDNGVLNVVFEKYTHNIFGAFKAKVILLFLLGILLPLIEITIAHYLIYKDQKKKIIEF